MSSKDLLALVPSVTTLLVGLIAVVVVPALRLSRTLRRDLAEDANIVNELPKAAQREFRSSMGSRSSLLTAFSRYPAVSRVELAAIFGVLLLGAAVFGSLSLTPPANAPGSFDFGAWGQGLLFTAFSSGMGTLAIISWATRTRHRLQYLDQHVEADVRREVGNSTLLTAVIVQGATRLTTLGPVTATLFIALRRTEQWDRGDTVSAVIATLLVLFYAGVTWSYTRISDLFSELPHRGTVMHHVWSGVPFKSVP